MQLEQRARRQNQALMGQQGAIIRGLFLNREGLARRRRNILLREIHSAQFDLN